MKPNCCKCGKCHEGIHGKPLLRVIDVKAEQAAQLEAAFKAALEGQRFIPDRDAREMMALGQREMIRCLAPTAAQQIKLFGTGRNSPVLVVKGLPAQKVIPPTPFLGFGDEEKTAFADLLLFGIYALMGVEPVAFDYENDGRLLRNVAPTLSGKGQKSSQGYDLDLRWHSDNPCGPFEPKQHPVGARKRSPSPRFLGFSGLRNADANGKPVPTRVLPVGPVLARLSVNTKAVLCQCEFRVNPPASNGCKPLVRVPLLDEAGGEYFLRFNFDPDQVQGMTKRANVALETLKAALEAATAEVIPVVVEPGTILVFDNYRVVHARDTFDPGADLSVARWLRRCYACHALAKGILVDAIHSPFVWK
jgi:hypothetical protein